MDKIPQASKLGTFFNLVKAYVAIGIVAVPNAMTHIGLLAGVIGFFLIGSICVYCMHLLVSCNRIITIKARDQEMKDSVKTVCGVNCLDVIINNLTSKSGSGSTLCKPFDISKLRKHREKSMPLINEAELECPRLSSPLVVRNNEQMSKPRNNIMRSTPLDIRKLKGDRKQSVLLVAIYDPPVEEISIQPDLLDFTVRRRESESSDFAYETELPPPKDDIKLLDYATTAEKAALFGPAASRFLAPWMRFSVNLFIFITHFGVGCVYVIFVAQSIYEIAQNMGIFTSAAVFDMMLLELPILIVLSWIPNLSKLSFISTIALILQSVGLVFLFSFFLTGEMSDNITPVIAPPGGWSLYFGTALYAFDGIGVVLPLINAMKKKDEFQGTFGVLNQGMCLVIVTYSFVAAGGYLKYGNSALPSITFNLPPGMICESIRLMIALAVFLSYPIQMYVLFSITIPCIKIRFFGASWKGWVKYTLECVIRTAFVVLSCLLANTVPMLDLVISVLGAFSSSSLALIIPALIHMFTIYEDEDIKRKKLLIIIDILICVFGAFGLAVGSFTAGSEIWNHFKSPALNLTSYPPANFTVEVLINQTLINLT